ncbi:ATP-binding protein, partial [Escherichia coli]|uniref:ATP-binding protein n=1 Tax=Escherichia coli TaxID=562 RepID=UPI003D8D4548
MNHLYEQLTALKLTGFRDALKKQLAQPGTYQELGFEERLSLLTAEELTCRENRKAERLIKHARFRLNAELSKLDYRNNRGLDRALIRSLSQGNWLTLKQNILLTGATGSGKTFLACALGHNACRQGYKVYYYCVFRSIRSRIGIEVRSAIRIHSINRELNFFYRFLTRFFAAFH